MDRVRSADGTTIALERSGSGPAVVVVGGALSTRAAVGGLAAAVADRLTVFAYDRRGRGDSGDTPPYAVEREIEDLAAVLEAAGGRAGVHGHSSGAVLALRAALALGSAIERLAVYEPPFVVDLSRPPVPDAEAERMEGLVAEGRRGEAVERFLLSGPLVPAEAIGQMRASPAWPALEAAAHTLPYDLRVMEGMLGGSVEPLRRFASLGLPTLVLDGSASPRWQYAGAEALARVLPDARRRTIEGFAHDPTPDVLGPVLVQWFSAAGTSNAET
jgi:pimeloyl-ACP methyl ester carboxylesterase